LFKDEVKLDDARRLAEVHVENDDVLALTLMKEDGTFEEIDITSPEAEEEGSAQ